jgi:tetratricopeptide (TPR) repeat protein
MKRVSNPRSINRELWINRCARGLWSYIKDNVVKTILGGSVLFAIISYSVLMPILYCSCVGVNQMDNMFKSADSLRKHEKHDEALKKYEEIENEIESRKGQCFLCPEKYRKIEYDYKSKLGSFFWHLSVEKNKTQNLQVAIRTFEEAKELIEEMKDQYPKDYLSTLSTLGDLYQELSFETHKRPNLLEAENYYKLIVDDNHKWEYPETYFEALGNTYYIGTEIAFIDMNERDIEARINDFKKGIEILNAHKDSFKPSRYSYYNATCLLDIAAANTELAKLSKATRKGNENKYLSTAILYLRKSLEVFSREDYPDIYRKIQLDLGEAYLSLSDYEDKEENLRNSIKSYEKALNSLGNDEKDLVKAADLKLDLGYAYIALSNSKYIDQKRRYSDKAKDYFIEALGIYNTKTDSSHYLSAATKLNSAQIYAQLYYLDTKNNETYVNKSIESYENALEFFTITSYPYYYAKIQRNLGVSYYDLSRIRTEKFAAISSINSINEYLRASVKEIVNVPYDDIDELIAINREYLCNKEIQNDVCSYGIALYNLGILCNRLFELDKSDKKDYDYAIESYKNSISSLTKALEKKRNNKYDCMRIQNSIAEQYYLLYIIQRDNNSYRDNNCLKAAMKGYHEVMGVYLSDALLDIDEELRNRLQEIKDIYTRNLNRDKSSNPVSIAP